MKTAWRIVRLKLETIFLLEAEAQRMGKLKDFAPLGANYKSRYSFDDIIGFLIGEKQRHRQRARKAHRKRREQKPVRMKG